jgi:predicted transcriptional regulator
MTVRTKPVRESQKKEVENAVARRYALLKEKGIRSADIAKDSVLKHLRAELRRANRRLFRIGFIEKQLEDLAKGNRPAPPKAAKKKE